MRTFVAPVVKLLFLWRIVLFDIAVLCIDNFKFDEYKQICIFRRPSSTSSLFLVSYFKTILWWKTIDTGSHQIIPWLESVRHSESSTGNIWRWGWMFRSLYMYWNAGWSQWFVQCPSPGRPRFVLSCSLKLDLFRILLLSKKMSVMLLETRFKARNCVSEPGPHEPNRDTL
jgi:hypothetical protein